VYSVELVQVLDQIVEVEMVRTHERTDEQDLQVAQIRIVNILTVHSPGLRLPHTMSYQLNQGPLQHVIEQVNIRGDSASHANHNVVPPSIRL